MTLRFNGRDRAPDSWDNFADFEATWEFWRAIDSRSGRNLFDSLDVKGTTLRLTNGPGQPMNSEGYLEYLVERRGTAYEVKTFEISRGDRDEYSSGSFSNFTLAGKYAIAVEVSEAIRQAVAPSLASATRRLDEMGLNPDWEPDPTSTARYPTCTYRDKHDPNIWFTGDVRFPSTSHYLNMTYQEINSSLSAGIDPPLVPEIPFTTS